VGGMRFVETTGWFGDNAVYAEGSANPYIAEYRIFDVQSGRMLQDYFGTSFATCGREAKVAYEVDTRYTLDKPGKSVEVNDMPIYTVPAASADVYLSLRDLHWSSDCTLLAFIEIADTKTTFVVLHETTVEARIPLQTNVVTGLDLTDTLDTFALRSTTGTFVYDKSSHTLHAAPEIEEQMRQRETKEARVVKDLGGRSAVLWRQRQ
ncbi:MAG: hypothetical protein WAN65_26020, partial [Candidatus Sulfotelmatobacter sp.]